MNAIDADSYQLLLNIIFIILERYKDKNHKRIEQNQMVALYRLRIFLHGQIFSFF